MVRLCTLSQPSHIANHRRSSLQLSSSAASTSPTGPLACSAPSNNNSNTNPNPNTRLNITPRRHPIAPPRAPTSKTPSSSSIGKRPTRRPTSPAASRSSSSSRLRHRRSSTRIVYLRLHYQARRRRAWGRAPARKSRRRGGEGCFAESSGVVSYVVSLSSHRLFAFFVSSALVSSRLVFFFCLIHSYFRITATKALHGVDTGCVVGGQIGSTCFGMRLTLGVCPDTGVWRLICILLFFSATSELYSYHILYASKHQVT
jgi:hypothetical protein